MRIISGVVPGVSRPAGLQVELSKRARQRLKWFDYYKSRGYNARLTCRYFGISPQTFYRWKRRYNPRHLERALRSILTGPGTLRQPNRTRRGLEGLNPPAFPPSLKTEDTATTPLQCIPVYLFLSRCFLSVTVCLR